MGKRTEEKGRKRKMGGGEDGKTRERRGRTADGGRAEMRDWLMMKERKKGTKGLGQVGGTDDEDRTKEVKERLR